MRDVRVRPSRKFVGAPARNRDHGVRRPDRAKHGSDAVPDLVENLHVGLGLDLPRVRRWDEEEERVVMAAKRVQVQDLELREPGAAEVPFRRPVIPMP